MKVIVLGSTGMVGEGVAHECVLDDAVEEVLLINRRPGNMQHQKIREIIHPDFLDITPIIAQLKGYDTCYFCLGTSSVGMNEKDYTKVTYELTMHVAKELLKINPDMIMTYVSGAGTDSSEKGRIMWARVKGKTENDLLNIGFKDAYVFRPGLIVPTPGLQNTLSMYKYLGFIMPVFRLFFSRYMTTLKELGQAMIAVTLQGQEKKILECPDIVEAAKRRIWL
jgi:uncharacterized protein YbjT (DUF2867 family)